MKKISVLIVLFSLLISCNCKDEKQVAVNVDLEKEQINTVLDTWHKDAAATNFEAYFNAMSTESVFIGTDASEIWQVDAFKKFSKPFFDKGSAWSFTPLDRNIYIYSDGKMAWFDEILETWMGVCRGSGVLQKETGVWKIKQYVLSLTIPNENIVEVVEINKERDSLFIARLKR